MQLWFCSNRWSGVQTEEGECSKAIIRVAHSVTVKSLLSEVHHLFFSTLFVSFLFFIYCCLNNTSSLIRLWFCFVVGKWKVLFCFVEMRHRGRASPTKPLPHMPRSQAGTSYHTCITDRCWCAGELVLPTGALTLVPSGGPTTTRDSLGEGDFALVSQHSYSEANSHVLTWPWTSRCVSAARSVVGTARSITNPKLSFFEIGPSFALSTLGNLKSSKNLKSPPGTSF